MSIELSTSTALVTGATAGIGRAVALQLAGLGADVVVHGRDAERGAATVAEIAAAGGRARFVATDLADADAVRHLAAEAGPVDLLVNNAGIYAFGPTADTDPAVFDAHIAVNLRAPFLLVGALAPAMAARGHGSIVNVTTFGATVPVAGGGLYGSTKAALELLTRSWADEFGAQGVRVNAVAPGPVNTLGTAGMGDAVAAIGRTTVLGRVAEAEEIAEAIVFLASPQASYINGTVVTAHGGSWRSPPSSAWLGWGRRAPVRRQPSSATVARTRWSAATDSAARSRSSSVAIHSAKACLNASPPSSAATPADASDTPRSRRASAIAATKPTCLSA